MHVCACTLYSSLEPVHTYTFICTYIRTYSIYLYSMYVRTYVCNCTQFEVLPLLPPLAVSKVYSKTTYVHTYMHTLYTCVHTYIHTYI